MEDKYTLVGPEQTLQNISFAKIIFDSLQNDGDKIAMINSVSGKETTYNEIFQKSVSLAQHLEKFGLNKYDVISICSENSVNFTTAVISALYLGVTIAPFNHFYTPREIINALNISKPKLVFTSSIALRNVIIACKEVTSVRKIILLDSNVEPPTSLDKLEMFVKLPVPRDFTVTPVELDHTAAIMCSSGTTGIPKGVMLSHQNLQSAHKFLTHPLHANFNSSNIGLGLLPFYHAYGNLTQLSMLIAHMKIIVMPRFEETLLWNSIEKYKITHLALVPPLLILLAKSPLVSKYNFSSVKEITCGAAPLSKEVRDLVTKRLDISNIRQGYGLTEATLAISYQPRHSLKSASSGIMVHGMKCQIRDIDTDKTLGPHQSGEICLKGLMVMKGYCGDKSATAATIGSDGWLRTGDIGYFDEDGHLYIVDRLKELIKYKAYQVPPAEIEALLLSHPQISDCAVIGKPDEVAGELPVAFVVKQPKATITAKDVVHFVAKNVSAQKRLHGGAIFVNSIPKSPTGKILRRILRDQFKIKSKI